MQYDVIIIGGGLAGLTAALHLGNQGIPVLLIEKDSFPRHRVCGEYVSNEVLPYLGKLGIEPMAAGARPIDRLELGDLKGRLIKARLPLGGFGISRYALDNMLYEQARQCADVLLDRVEEIEYQQERFHITTRKGKSYAAPYVLGAFGKRSNLDRRLGRPFMEHRSLWMAVKAHYKFPFDDRKVGLYQFPGGYCGLSKTETGAVNACYLASDKYFRKYRDIQAFQEAVLVQNPQMHNFFDKAVPIFKKPMAISQISFRRKPVVFRHIFMIGDSAGLIHPLCGNGMAMAIRAAKLWCDLYLEGIPNGTERHRFEEQYRASWEHTFGKRLRSGRQMQRVLTTPWASRLAGPLLQVFPGLLPGMIKRTHGQAF